VLKAVSTKPGSAQRQGGLQKEGGELANKRHQMSEKRFQESGGMVERADP